MRTDNYNFATINQSTVVEPRFVVELSFDSANTDVIYITSADVDGLSGENVYIGLLEKISGTSQKINPDKAVATIGAISFSALDHGLTSLIRDKLNDNKGLKGKRVRFWVGERSLAWADYVLTQTQIVDDLEYKDGVYSVKCADIQRQMRETIFETKKANITSAEVPTDRAPADHPDAGLPINGTIHVVDASGFEMVKHSSSGQIDAPGQRVGYLKLPGGCIVRYTGINEAKTAFTGCTWGVLNTSHLIKSVEVGEGDQEDAPKAEEYVYLEMPAVKLAYAILTGFIYGETGEKIPDHWHLGISPEWIRTSDFINIGSDWWDLDNDANGITATLRGLTKTDGKKFIEEEILLMLGAFMPVYATGELGLRRMTAIPSLGSYVRELDEDDVVSYGDLKHDLGATINRVVINWNYDEQKEGFTRRNVLMDEESINRHGVSPIKELSFRLMASNRHTYDTIKYQFDSLRDRYAGPPLRLSLTLTPPNNDLEVGDIVRVRLGGVRDYTGETSNGHLNRNFEVQQVRTDWITGRVTVELFGSSQPASALPPEEYGSALANEWYSSEGTEISPANFGSAVQRSGNHTIVVGTIELTGHDNLRHSDAIYWTPGDLTVALGGKIIYNRNTQIRVRGFFQINGVIDGAGRGPAGGTSYEQDLYHAYYGTTEAGAGVIMSHMSIRLLKPVRNLFVGRGSQSLKGEPKALSASRSQNLTVTSSGALEGVPDDLRGSPGPKGSAARNYNPRGGDDVEAFGGDGGNGGAGLLIVSRGCAFGASGRIDSSGADGAPGGALRAIYSMFNTNMYLRAGSGAGGCPGAVLFVIDGRENPPYLTNSNSVARMGVSRLATSNYIVTYASMGQYSEYYNPDLFRSLSGANQAVGSGEMGTGAPVNGWTRNDKGWIVGAEGVGENMAIDGEAYRIVMLTGYIKATPDTPTYAKDPVAVILSEATNTPKSADGNLSTIEASVIAPNDPAYSHALIEYRRKGQSGWFMVGPASPEAAFVVPSDGEVYEVRARAVGKGGGISASGPVAEITTTNVTRPDNPAEEPVIKIPNVHGLELFEQGHDTEFTGRDAKFSWRKTSITEWFEIGSEPQGASSGALDLYFRDYQVEIWAENQVVRTEWVVDNHYTYTYEKNAEDYQRVKGQAGAWREFAVRVSCRGRQNQLSKVPAVLNVSNPAPELPTNLTVSAGFKVAMVDFDPPTDLDYKETRVYLSTESGFTPDDSNRVAVTVGGPVTLQKLDDGTTYYLRVQPFDAFGPGPLSSEFTVTTLKLDADDIDGLSPWATVTEADREFIEEHLADNSIPSTKIEKLVASKIVTGTLAATEKISVEGQIESISGPYAAVLGPKALGGKAALLSFTNSGIPIFALYEDGTASFKGSVEITGGSTGFANLTDVPPRFGNNNAPTVAGLYMTASYLGYHNGNGATSGWSSYIQSNGNFRFGSNGGNNYISWNGAVLTVRGDVHATSIAASASISAPEITGGTLSGTTVSGATVTGSTITGGTVQTSTSNTKRVLIDGATNEMYFYQAGALKARIGSQGIGSRNATGYFINSGNYSVGAYGEGASIGLYGVSGNHGAGVEGYVHSSHDIDSCGVYGQGPTGTLGYSSKNYGRGLHGIAEGPGGVGVEGFGDTRDFYATGPGTNYAPFTGSHDALIKLSTPANPLPPLEEGDILRVTRIVARGSLSNIIPEVEVCTESHSKAVYGIMTVSEGLPESVENGPVAMRGLSQDEYELFGAEYCWATVNALGEGQINVCDENGDFEVGDFICTSNLPGKGMRYDGHDMRVVVAKIMEPVNWADVEPDEFGNKTKKVACIYMCG